MGKKAELEKLDAAARELRRAGLESARSNHATGELVIPAKDLEKLLELVRDDETSDDGEE